MVLALGVCKWLIKRNATGQPTLCCLIHSAYNLQVKKIHIQVRIYILYSLLWWSFQFQLYQSTKTGCTVPVMAVVGSCKIKACYKEAAEKTWGRATAICCISSRLPKLSLGRRGKINHDKDSVGEDKEEEWKEELKTQSSILLKPRSEGRGRQRTTSVGRRGQRVINVPFYEDWRKVSSLHQAVPGKHRPLFGNQQLRVGQLTHAFYHNLHCLQRLTGHPGFCISVRADSWTAERNSHKKTFSKTKAAELGQW